MTKAMNCICHYNGVTEEKNGELKYIGGAEAKPRPISADTKFAHFVRMMEDLCGNNKKDTFISMKHIVFGVACKVDNDEDYQAMFAYYQTNPQKPLTIWITKHTIIGNPPQQEAREHDPLIPNIFTIHPYSSLSRNAIEKYDTPEFESGGYKWKLSFYPNGNKKKLGATGYISLYLVMVDTASLPSGWEIDVAFKFFFFNHIKDEFVPIEGCSELKFNRYNGSNLESGYSYLIPVTTFIEPSRGYLANDICKFGVDVHVSKWPVDGKGLTVVKDDYPTAGNFTWETLFFEESTSSIYSPFFMAGGHQWQMQLYRPPSSPSWVNLYLHLRSSKEKLKATFNVRLRNRLNRKDIEFKGTAVWFNNNAETRWGKGQNFYWCQQQFIAADVLNDEVNGFRFNQMIILDADISVLG